MSKVKIPIRKEADEQSDNLEDSAYNNFTLGRMLLDAKQSINRASESSIVDALDEGEKLAGVALQERDE